MSLLLIIFFYNGNFIDEKILETLDNKISLDIKEGKHYRTSGYLPLSLIEMGTGYPDYFNLGIGKIGFGLWRITIATELFKFHKTADKNISSFLPFSFYILAIKPEYMVELTIENKRALLKKIPPLSIKTRTLYLYTDINYYLTSEKFIEGGLGGNWCIMDHHLFLIPLTLEGRIGYRVIKRENYDYTPVIGFNISTGLWVPDFNFKDLKSDINMVVFFDGSPVKPGAHLKIKKGEHFIKLRIKNYGEGWTLIPFIFTVEGKATELMDIDFGNMRWSKDSEGWAVNTGKIIKPNEKIEINFPVRVIKKGTGSLIFEWADITREKEVKDITIFLHVDS